MNNKVTIVLVLICAILAASHYVYDLFAVKAMVNDKLTELGKDRFFKVTAFCILLFGIICVARYTYQEMLKPRAGPG